MDDQDLRDIRRAARRRELLEPATIWGKHLTSSRARQHLVEGFNRRVLMLECSIEHIEEMAEKAGDSPVSTRAVPELAIHVNAYWLNLCGALDNLAWGLAYEMELVEGLSELPGEGRDLVGLGKTGFVTRVEQRDGGFGAALRSFLRWQKDLRDLRDPAAHRIPLYPVPGVLSGERAKEAERLYDEANKLMSGGDLHEGLGLIDQANSLARYEPWMTLSHAGLIETRHLHRQMYSDEDQFAAIAKVVLNRLFRDAPGYRAI